MVLSVAPIQSSALTVAVGLQGLMPAVSIAISGNLINSVSSGILSDRYHLMYVCSLWAGSLLVYNLIGPVILFLQGRIAQKAIYKVNSDILYKSSLIHGLEVFENKIFHDDIQIIQSQASHKPLNLLVTLIGVFKDSLLTVSCLGLLYRQMPWISLFIGFGAYLNFKVFSQIQKINWQETLGRSPKSRLMNYIASISANPVYAKELRFFPIGSYLLENYKTLFNEITKSMSQIQMKHIYLPIIPLCFSVLGMVTSLWIILSRVQAQVIPIGSIAIVLQGLTQLHLSICSLGEQLGWIPGHVLFFNKFFNFLTLKETVFHTIPDTDGALHKTIDPINILFENVSFTYPGKASAQALTNISFSIGKGQRVAIVGANGAGKSTLIKLVCGLYAPDSGTIRINGLSIDSIDLEDFRSHIAPVFQDFCPYALSVEKNITMGAPTTETLQVVTS